MRFENDEPTAKEIVFALKCNGYCDCDECFYKANRAYRNCQEVAKKDAACLIEKVVNL